MKKVLAVVALVSCMFMMTGCVTSTSLGAAQGPHGLFSSFQGTEDAATDEAKEIGSYHVVFGLIDLGYTGFANSVKSAKADGKELSSVTKSWFILPIYTTKAYAK